MFSPKRVAFLGLLSCFAITLVGFTSTAAEAAGGRIKGVATDPKGAVIRGAAVTVTDPLTNRSFTATTDEQGRYQVEGVPAGTYAVIISAQGFTDGRREEVRVAENETASVDFRLEVATIEAGTVTIKPNGAKSNSDPVYQQLRQQAKAVDEFQGPFAVVHNLVLKRDVAIFTLISGEIYFLKPVEGRVTGAVFIGQGELTLAPPTQAEKHSLALFTDEPSLTEKLDHLTIRFTDRTFDEIKASPKATMGTNGPRAQDARNIYRDNQTLLRKRLRTNMELRALADLYAPSRPGFFVAFIGGERFKKLVFELDPLGVPEVSPEEVALTSYGDTDRGIWTAFHLSEEYAKGVAASSEDHRVYHIIRHDIDGAIHGTNIAASDRIKLRGLVPDTRVLPFSLFRSLRVSEVQDEQGRELDFIQEGKDEDADFAVVLAQPLPRDQVQTIIVHYDGGGALRDTGGGNFILIPRETWYPNNAQMPFGDRAMFDMTFRYPKGNMFVGTGSPVSPDARENGQKISHWSSGETELPVAGFNYGKFKKKEVLDKSTGYNIEFYANEEMPGGVGTNAPGAIYTAGGAAGALADAENSTRIYDHYFGKLPYSRLAMTQQPAANFGQAWPTLVYMPFTAFLDSTQRWMLTGSVKYATADFFRYVAPHEVAHQWWGNTVGWDSYRDQWMSEGFAEFSASLYVQFVQNDLSKFIEFWDNQRKLIIEARPETRDRRPYTVGPVTQGYRLDSGKTGSVARFMIYPKGAYILHMLRMMMWERQTADAKFQAMMHEFLKTYYNKNASTEDFKGIVEKHMTKLMDLDENRRMDWFFNEWVYGTEMPVYRFEYHVESSNGKAVLTGRITQSGVSKQFKALVPLYVDFGKGWGRLGSATLIGNASIDLPAQVLQAPPKRVAICALDDVLAQKIENAKN